MVYCSLENEEGKLESEELKEGLCSALDSLGKRRRVIAVPPDITRFHSYAGFLTEKIWEYYGPALADVLPAIGTHTPMSSAEISMMYRNIPEELFRVHDFREGITTLGTIPSEVVNSISGEKLELEWPVQVNSSLADGRHDLILSIGQVVPHEVTGMANHNKNIYIGTGGAKAINASHYLGALYGMEKTVGRIKTPVRDLLNYAESRYGYELPVLYILTVVGTEADGSTSPKGLFIGDDEETFLRAARLSQKVNITTTGEYFDKIVVYLDPTEFKSTWLGNKAIYRSRTTVRSGGEICIIAPGIRRFGEDEQIDRLIRRHGYSGTDKIRKAVENDEELQNNLAAAAHLIHGSSEGRFSIRYCPGELSKAEVEEVGYLYGDLSAALNRYSPEDLHEGKHRLSDGEEFYFIRTPALGLWSAEAISQ